MEEKYFKEMAITNPEQFLRLLESGELPPSRLTYAVEYAGHCKNHLDEALAVLLRLHNHASPLVREGVICGLERFAKNPEVQEVLAFHADAEHEPSSDVREAARDAIDSLTCTMFF